MIHVRFGGEYHMLCDDHVWLVHNVVSIVGTVPQTTHRLIFSYSLLKFRGVRQPGAKHYFSAGQYPCCVRNHHPSALRSARCIHVWEQQDGWKFEHLRLWMYRHLRCSIRMCVVLWTCNILLLFDSLQHCFYTSTLKCSSSVHYSCFMFYLSLLPCYGAGIV
jgi:hypothetical protein